MPLSHPKCLSRTHDLPRHGDTRPAGDPRQAEHHSHFPDTAKTPMQPSHKNKTGWNFLRLSFLFWNYSSLTPGYAGFSPPEMEVSAESCSLPFSILLLKTDFPSSLSPTQPGMLINKHSLDVVSWASSPCFSFWSPSTFLQLSRLTGIVQGLAEPASLPEGLPGHAQGHCLSILETM